MEVHLPDKYVSLDRVLGNIHGTLTAVYGVGGLLPVTVCFTEDNYVVVNWLINTLQYFGGL